MADIAVTEADREQRNPESNPAGRQNSRLPNFLRKPYTVTGTLIAINLMVFAAMVIGGVSFTQPTPLDALSGARIWSGDRR